MERKRLEEWETQRKNELVQHRQREQERVLELKAKQEHLNTKLEDMVCVALSQNVFNIRIMFFPLIIDMCCTFTHFYLPKGRSWIDLGEMQTSVNECLKV